MGQTFLHLVDRHGVALPVELREALEAAYRWATHDFPRIDRALVAGWTEEVGGAMVAKGTAIQSPRRYAFAALHGKIRAWFRKNPGRELAVGIGPELEAWLGMDQTEQLDIDHGVLFDQLRAKLSERDRQILVLLLQDITSPASVAEALGVGYFAAAKAIQRVKQRLAAILVTGSRRETPVL